MKKYSHRLSRLLGSWVYLPGLAMILLGVAVLLFPRLVAWAVATFFILVGLVSIQSIRILRRLARRVRAQVAFATAEALEEIPAPAFPEPPYTTWIN